jgi:hypothetical protein
VPETQPFLRHAFLSALEDSGSVGPIPAGNRTLLHVEGDRLIAALPSYRKWHSYGEYVFDHAWADACERAGIDYYPKLLTAVPFSPVSGPRLLAARVEDGFELLKSLPGYLESNSFPALISISPIRSPTRHWPNSRAGCSASAVSTTGRTAVIGISRTSSKPSAHASANRCARSASRWRGRALISNGWKDGN